MPVTLAIIGAGSRGRTYADYARHFPERAKVVAIAEPRAEYRRQLAAQHGVPDEACFESWEDLAGCERLANAAVIATPDHLHVAPACALAARGYHLLLEKPMAPTEAGCREVFAAVQQAGVILSVGHVLRYTRYTRGLRSLLDSGCIGKIVSIQHLEPVGWWHQAHSFVRGNWRSTQESSFMLLAKSCHDIDWLCHVAGAVPERVSSFGSLTHFRPENRPARATDRCVDCPVESDCPYSAVRLYQKRADAGETSWPLNVLTPEPTPQSIRDALQTGPYGRCVYACDNDVVDHQVVNMEFAGGITVAFTMTAFTPMMHRQTRIFGTRGMLTGDGRTLTVYDFVTSQEMTLDTEEGSPSDQPLQGHGGGDFGFMDGFIRAVASGDTVSILSGPEATLQSHLAVFAAERARLEGRVVEL